MAVALAMVKRAGGKYGVLGIFTVTLSGNYTTNGDACDFGPVIGLTNRQPDQVQVDGTSGWNYFYDLVNKKLVIRGQQPTSGTAGIIPLDEMANGAYPASASGDKITAICWWLAVPKLT